MVKAPISRTFVETPSDLVLLAWAASPLLPSPPPRSRSPPDSARGCILDIMALCPRLQSRAGVESPLGQRAGQSSSGSCLACSLVPVEMTHASRAQQPNNLNVASIHMSSETFCLFCYHTSPPLRYEIRKDTYITCVCIFALAGLQEDTSEAHLPPRFWDTFGHSDLSLECLEDAIVKPANSNARSNCPVRSASK